MVEMDIKRTWDEATDQWVKFVRSGKDITRDEMNNPSMFSLLGDIRGARILDIACGEGYNCRLMAQKGASVMGVDISARMIQFAVEQEKVDGLGIEYHVSDASKLDMVDDASIDVVTCFMAIMDIENYRQTIKDVSRVLREDGRFVFNITHPCFESRVIDGDITGGWEQDGPQGYGYPDRSPYYKVDNYFETQEKEAIRWEMERLDRPFTTISIHRTLTEYSEAIHEAGLLISRMIEPTPTKRGMEKLPALRGCLRIPHSIAIEVVKNSNP